MKITVVRGDITKMEVDAIVNAANSRLAGGGGVDGAIHLAGGPEIMNECDKIRNKQGGCPTGEAVLTCAASLKAKKVIHAVGPVWQGGLAGEPDLLASAYRNSLRIAAENNLYSIAFPMISTGVYGYPKKEAARVALSVVQDYLKTNKKIREVVFVCFDEESYRIYTQLLSI